MRLKTLEHAVKVVGSNLDEAAIFKLRESFRGLATQVSQDAHDKRQFFYFDGVANLNIVRDMHPRRANPLELLMDAFFCHVCPLNLPLSAGSGSGVKTVSARRDTRLHRHGLSRFALPVNYVSSPRTCPKSPRPASQIENISTKHSLVRFVVGNQGCLIVWNFPHRS